MDQDVVDRGWIGGRYFRPRGAPGIGFRGFGELIHGDLKISFKFIVVMRYDNTIIKL